MGCSRMLVRRAAEEAGGVLGDAMALHQDALSLTDHDAPSDGGNQRRPPLATIRKCRAAAIGLDRSFAGHSLRSGFATEAYAQRTPELAIIRQGRWKSAGVMCGYVG
jgi:hypothetical protein